MKEYQSQIRDVKMGKDVTVVHPVNLYECEIGDGTFIGPFVEIQKGAKIGKNCRIQSHTFICEGVTIDDDVFVGHGVVFINDKNPQANNDKWKLEPTIVCMGASIGSNATILPVVIEHFAKIGAGAVVTKQVYTCETVVGNPAKPIKKRS
jgi:acetyltransferase-like isoleucine patch superfamily enzyme